VVVLGARRRGGLRGAVAVAVEGPRGGDLLDVHEGGEEVILGADLVEAIAFGATATAEVIWEAEGDLRSGPAVVRPAAGACADGGGNARPGGSAGSGCCCIARPTPPRNTSSEEFQRSGVGSGDWREGGWIRSRR